MNIFNITEQFVVEYGRQVKHTFVDSLFGGYLMSTVTCEECKNVSFHQSYCVINRKTVHMGELHVDIFPVHTESVGSIKNMFNIYITFTCEYGSLQ